MSQISQVKTFRKPWSLIVAVMALLGMIVWHYRIQAMNLMPPCTFRMLTGWYCPGCGGRRSIAALGRGEVLTALRMNLLLYVFAALLLWVFFRLIRNEWTSGPMRPVDLSSRVGWAICYFVFGFWVLRNIPAWPFELLAP